MVRGYAFDAILLPMPDDPQRYWRDLTENYGQMSDGELLDLGESRGDLTEMAQQVLRDEMRKRGLDDAKPVNAAHITGQPAVVHWESPRYRDRAREAPDESDEPGEFTWKTLLCECDTSQEAWQVGETLRRAGIESWVTGSRSTWDVSGPRVQVAADQLEQAQAVLASPIPPEVIAESQMEVPEFALPGCPQCGASDPLLESVDPVNTWLCESCGAEWSDPEDGSDDGEKSSGE
jgi:hypothetical protein